MFQISKRHCYFLPLHYLLNDHNSFGWYIYVPFLLLLFVLGNRLADPVEEKRIEKITLTHSPHLPSIIICFVIGFSSSLLVRNIGLPTTSATHNASKNANEPVVHYFEKVEERQTANGKTLIFNFSPADLDSTPTFFDNELVPEHWQIVEEELQKDAKVVLIKNAVKFATITIKYQLGDFSTGSAFVFKKHRLKHSMSGRQYSQLIWTFATCRSPINQTVTLRNCVAANTF
jgi:hypothetical protein